ncbi:MAG TPA: DUF1800 domain-containing protein [Thermoanaerobaculia bacterium]|nr:DUF1800 domain-containing protein [Thermoanaerobaculia bacterium]
MKRILAGAALLLVAATPTTERQRAEHALNRLAFGARPGDVERVARMGVDRWIEQQLHPERIDDRAVEARVARYDVALAPDRDRKKVRQNIANAASQRIVRAAESERQLNEVMTDFWLNHFNVFAPKRVTSFLIADYERDTIRPRIWGRFEDLLLATAKSPAMLVYLDNARSRNEALNENYARELMELHTIGVDAGYTQKDVTELARVLTGWSITREGEFRFRPALHDRGSKTVLGVRTCASCGIEEGERMIRFLARHPATAKHIATKLCTRLVSDQPSPQLIERVAKRFRDTNGDLRETVKAVIDSPEFWSSRGAKLKSPFEYAVSAVRAAGARIDDPLPLARELRKMGEGLYLAQPPTGYSDQAEAWSGTGATLARVDFAVALANNKLPGVRVQTSDAEALAKHLGAPEFQKQ